MFKIKSLKDDKCYNVYSTFMEENGELMFLAYSNSLTMWVYIRVEDCVPE